MDDNRLVNFRHHMFTPKDVNRHAQRNLKLIPDSRQPNWKNDPLYYAADRIRQKRRKQTETNNEPK